MATTDFNNRLITPELKEALAGYQSVVEICCCHIA